MSYLTTGRKNPMYGTRRTGVRLVLTDSTDPTRVDGYSTWYDEYGDALLRIGRLINDFRFEKTSATGDEADPGFAAVFDIATPDLATAWPDAEASPDYRMTCSTTRATRSPRPCWAGRTHWWARRRAPANTGRSQACTSCCQTAPSTRVANTGSTACSTPTRSTRPPGSVSSTARRTRRSGSRPSRPTTRSPRTPSRGH